MNGANGAATITQGLFADIWRKLNLTVLLATEL